jgi:sulfide:quinone oxidoreductase
MVITLGAQLTPQRIPGLAEAGTTFYTVEGAEAIRDGRTGFMRGRLVVLVAGLPFKCPAAPYEAAMLLEHDLRRRGVREQVEVSLHTPEPGPMGVTGPKVSAAVRGLVEDRGIGYHPQHAVAEVDPGAKEITFADGDRAPYDWLVYIPPVSAPAVVVDAGLTDESGWIKVDPHTLETGHAGVYAIGDVTTIPVATGAPLPKAGVFADHEAKVVANNISVRLTSAEAVRPTEVVISTRSRRPRCVCGARADSGTTGKSGSKRAGCGGSTDRLRLGSRERELTIENMS